MVRRIIGFKESERRVAMSEIVQDLIIFLQHEEPLFGWYNAQFKVTLSHVSVQYEVGTAIEFISLWALCSLLLSEGSALVSRRRRRRCAAGAENWAGNCMAGIGSRDSA